MEAFFELINHPWVPWSLAAAIVFSALLTALIFTRRINALQQAIRPDAEALRKIPKKDFLAHYEEFNQQVSANLTLAHNWEQFSQSLILPDEEEGEPIRATQRPEAFFDETGLVASRLNLRFYQSVPNILVGVGLLFTFIGLIAALYFASEGVTAKDIAATQEALGKLLHAATFKFVTSVAGLFSSLVFSWWEKHCLHTMQKTLDDFCQLLEERLVFTSQEQLAYLHIRETRRQTLQLERFNADFAVSVANNISKTLDNTFAQRLQTALDGLVLEIQKLGDKLGKAGEEGMQDLLNRFLEKLKGGTGVEMDSLKTTLADLDASIKESAKTIEAASRVFSTQVENGAQPLTTATDNFKTSVEALDSIVKNAQSSGQTLLDVRDTLKETCGSLENATQPFNEATQNLKEAAEKVSAEKIAAQDIASHLQKSIENIKIITENLSGLAIGIKNLTKKGEDALGDAGASITDGAKKATADITQELGNASKSLVNGVEKFNASINELKTIVDSANGVGTEILQAHENLSESSKTLKTASSSIDDSLKKLTGTLDAVQKLSITLSEHSNTTEKGINTLKTLTTNLATSEETIKATWGKYQSRFENVDEHAGKMFGEINQGLDKYREQVQTFVVGLTDQFERALGTLSAVIEDLQESLEEFRNEKYRGGR